MPEAAGGRRPDDVARIAGATHDGFGIAALPGRKLLVAGALEGEVVRLGRLRRRRRHDEAELLEVLEASPERVTPRCAVYGICGGCSQQHRSPETQRAVKQRALGDSLERLGGVRPRRWLEPVADDGGSGVWHYRRRARLAVKDVPAKGRVLVGFRERRAPFVTDMHRCETLAAPVHALLDPLSALLGRLSIRRRLPQIEVAVGERQTRLVLRVLDPPDAADREHLRDFAARHGVTVQLQPGGPDSVADLYPQKPPLLSYSLPEFDVELEFDATDFVQINAAVNRRLVRRAVELLGAAPGERVLDLYCGIGNFSLPLARCAGAVLGIDGAANQIARARANARQNGIDNARFLTADLDAVDGSEAWLDGGWQRLLIDPARAGALEIARRVERIGAERIVYVSCQPRTLARDAGEICARGYRLEAAGIVDMFPHTGHIESLAVFGRHSDVA